MSFASSNKQRISFFATVGVFVALFLVITGPFLPYAVTGWFPDTNLGDHRVHEVSITTMLLVLLGGVLTQVRRPEAAPLALAGSFLIMLVVFLVRAASSDLFPPLLVFIVLFSAATALHPARRHLLRPWRQLRPALLVLALVGLAAATPYALGHSGLQRDAPATDEHAHDGHWSTMAAIAVAAPALVLLGAGSGPGWRYPVTGAVVLATVIGGISLAYPENASALPAAGAVAALAWGLTLVVLLVRPLPAPQDARDLTTDGT